MSKKHGKQPEKECGVQPTEQNGINTEAAKITAESDVHGCTAKGGEQSTPSEHHCQEQGNTTDGKTVQQAQTEQEAQPEPSEAEKLALLEAKCRELQDQYLRKAADFDNYRKRMIKEKQEAIDYANTNLLSDLLQILDDFDRAIEAGGKPEEGSPTAAFAQGVVMIRNGLLSLLESKYGLQYYESQGKTFDPDIHEAVATNPSAEVTEPTVGAELQKGYKLKERVLRPAKVMVLMPIEAK